MKKMKKPKNRQHRQAMSMLRTYRRQPSQSLTTIIRIQAQINRANRPASLANRVANQVNQNHHHHQVGRPNHVTSHAVNHVAKKQLVRPANRVNRQASQVNHQSTAIAIEIDTITVVRKNHRKVMSKNHDPIENRLKLN